MPRWDAVFEALPPVGAVRRSQPSDPGLHPALGTLWREVGWGLFGRGFLQLSPPEVWGEDLALWLGGEDPARVSIGRTALGDLLYLRDLRGKARSLGYPEAIAAGAMDVSRVDVRYKRVDVLATSLEQLAVLLGDPQWLDDVLRKDLFDAAVDRIGEPGEHEMFGFVPALALGGEESADHLQRVAAREHLALLFQL